jgi:hypothetical protein
MTTFYQILKTMQQQKIKLLILLNKVLFEGGSDQVIFIHLSRIFGGCVVFKTS